MEKADEKRDLGKSIFDNFRKPIPKEKWQKDHQEAAETYDKQHEAESTADEMPLSGERLKKIAEAKKQQSTENEDSKDALQPGP